MSYFHNNVYITDKKYKFPGISAKNVFEKRENETVYRIFGQILLFN